MRLTKAQSQKLAKIFRKYHVEAAYLFGSQANKKTHAGSDTDIAVRFSKDISLRQTLDFINEISPFFPSRVDLADLGKAPLPLRYRVYAARHLLFARDPRKEVLERAKAVSLYHDYKYYYDRFARFELERIAVHGLT